MPTVSAFEYLMSEMVRCHTCGMNDIEAMGFAVGHRYVENISSQQRLMGRDPLDLMKFICKDLWEELFNKKIDKLQTNHRGVFVLSDFHFCWLNRYKNDEAEADIFAQRLLNFICGFIRGVLFNLGLITVVSTDRINAKAYGIQFNIKLKTVTTS